MANSRRKTIASPEKSRLNLVPIRANNVRRGPRRFRSRVSGEADFQAWRDERDWTERKYALFAETDLGEADLETTISDLMSGQYSDPVRVVAFNTSEHWSEDASEDVAREIRRRLDLVGGALPSLLAAFVDNHVDPDRQLTLRLA